MILRSARPDDAAALADLFWRAVQEGAAGHYCARERRAWLPARPDAAAMAARLAGLWIVVAEAEGRLQGFMALRDDGYLDLAFVAPPAMGQGVADRLLGAVEAEARRRGIGRIDTHASRQMRSFLTRMGWEAGPEAPVTRNGVSVARWPMWVLLPEE